ncbi:MAG: hypothetical protein AAGH40_01755 [Verrucomicrobiota bacterium]
MRSFFISILILSSCFGFSETLSFEYENTNVIEVLDHIRKNSDLNLAYSETNLTNAQGDPTKITIRLESVSPTLALEVVAQASGCKLEKNESVYIIQPDVSFTDVFFEALANGELLDEMEEQEGSSIESRSFDEFQITRDDDGKMDEELKRSFQRIKEVERSLEGREVYLRSRQDP